ncbi:toll/interleukin-1 receptor domain-containing protein [Lentzea sp. NBRC 102530]|uniref:toll/interleukin-1 receptor domain-containing protein n=1 Tax=Lentzea sp. NBRC 102530 TaxID=3032201 RepID=UPI00249FD610|nr:toll/interleukin-1 receptor domain-containing protein [Lentzea sp. NBRC 102530]GLY50190.1 hypothetical protein Lesp01_38460 [Lentzea sp. NBRC 102530]
MPHVFLSYSRSDRGLANRVREDLIAQGVDVWSDRRLGLGGSWLSAISTAIDEAQAVVVLATPAALASQWVMREVEAARTLGRRIVPVLADGARFGDLPAAIAGINGVDLADGYEEAILALSGSFNDPGAPVQVASARLPELLLLTSDDAVAAIVADVARPVGLAVVRRSAFAPDVLEVASSAHLVVIAGCPPAECLFLAGFAAGRGTWVLWVSPSDIGLEAAVRAGAPLRFCEGDQAALEREIGAVAFLPSQRTAQQPREAEGVGVRQLASSDRSHRS